MKFGGYQRFYELFESVLSFFADEDVVRRGILELRQADIAYLADLCVSDRKVIKQHRISLRENANPTTNAIHYRKTGGERFSNGFLRLEGKKRKNQRLRVHPLSLVGSIDGPF
ncbi:hypothetical protein M513_06479 [Trichuris suis]|uniref:Uncharacterized protein n=1 Tax=Trichuris suis TaxID=68888 RepID=A0A085M5Y6_9BILA|nr:hypothetical protein M513_06479 [Trichuris suis]